MKTHDQEHLEVLKNLVKEAKYGDEHGIQPDITPKEIESVEWAINKIEY